MMRFILLLVVLILSVWLGVQLHANPGYILIAMNHYIIETTPLIAILSLIILFAIIHFLLRFIRSLFSMSDRFHNWSQRRRLRQSQNKTNTGLMELAEGDWYHAEKKLMQAAHESKSSLINYLASARAAQAQGAYDRRDEYLKLAYTENPEAKFAIEISQAKLQLEEHQYEQALATLKHLEEIAPRHHYVLQLLQQVYVALNDWDHLILLIPKLRKYRILPESEIAQLEITAYDQMMLHQFIQDKTTIGLRWQSLPRRLRRQPKLVYRYVIYLIDNQKNVEAEEILRNTLKKEWVPPLVELYGKVNAHSLKQFAQAESWLTQHPKDPFLLLTLGRLAAKNQLWGKARSYLEASVGFKPTIEGYIELGQLLEKLNEMQEAKNYYQKALALKTKTKHDGVHTQRS